MREGTYHECLRLVINDRPDGQIPSAADDFQFAEPRPKPWQLAKALWISRSKGYASFIQPEYVTECTVQQEAGTAYGIVRFAADGFYSGTVSYVARRVKGEWLVEELQMPNPGVSLHRTDDGNWRPLMVAISGDSSQQTDAEQSND